VHLRNTREAAEKPEKEAIKDVQQVVDEGK
jgi:hypothetical protein